MSILVVHSSGTVGLALMARLLEFSEVTMLRADRAQALAANLDRPAVVVLGPCLSESDRAHLLRRLSRRQPPVCWIDLSDGTGPRLTCADDDASSLGSAVKLALS